MKYIKCCRCNKSIRGEYKIVNNDFYCEICYDNLLTWCEDCGERIRKDEACINSKGEYICKKCFDNNYEVCVSCGSIENSCDVRMVDEYVYCPSCFHERYEYCDECDEYHRCGGSCCS